MPRRTTTSAPPSQIDLAVAIFMTGTIAEVRQMLEIGSAILRHREGADIRAGVTSAATPNQPAAPRPRRARTASTPAAADNSFVAAPVATPATTAAATTPPTAPKRRRGRPPISRDVAADTAAVAAPVNELPPQDVDETFVDE